MSNNTGIEWTDATWNPIRGCSRVSEGCRNCYAERVAARFSGPGQPYEGLVRLGASGGLRRLWTGKVDLVEKHLLDPLKWGTKIALNPECPENVLAGAHGPGRADCICRQRSRRIFVNSMSDLFHPNVPDEWIDRIFAVMALCPQHTFQVLTKRPERMLQLLADLYFRERVELEVGRVIEAQWPKLKAMPAGCEWSGDHVETCLQWPLPNVHLGVSVENQATADERIPLLLQTPAAVRFISAEPLLGAVDLSCLPFPHDFPHAIDGPSGDGFDALRFDDRNSLAPLPHLDWVICGGESGPGARPMHPDWARGLRDQCVAAGVPFFFKQWGEWIWRATWGDSTGRTKHIFEDGLFVEGVGKKAAGSLLDGREWKQFPGTPVL